MGYQLIPVFQTDALPRICQHRSCYQVALKNDNHCAKHRIISPRRQPFVPEIKGKAWIYFISGGDLIKIGQAQNVIRRLRHLQAASPIGLKLEAKVFANVTLEKELHEMFKEYRMHGEWFRRCEKLEKIIKQYCDGI